ncbi:MAG TPA: hypothetical protein VHW60_18585 [Caulobacteraceae bacterium]|jgi:hypothetical protein|nr:hypothetical protein [Caulobacteraceae bacterium]
MPVDASHFSMVGFPVEMTQAGLSTAAQVYLSQCTPTQLAPSDVVCLVKDVSGGEMRLALRTAAGGPAVLVTMNPAFVGQGRTNVEIGADVSDPEEEPFEVTLTAHFTGDPSPLVFDLADPSEAARMLPGAKVTIDLAAFSFEPHVYADEAAFQREQDKQRARVKFAPTFFIPTGMFFQSVGGAMPNGATRPVSYADFAGKVLTAELKVNHAGGGRFWSALVQTYDGATVDVVMDPSTLPDGVKPGEILTGRFWLSARLAPAS